MRFSNKVYCDRYLEKEEENEAESSKNTAPLFSFEPFLPPAET